MTESKQQQKDDRSADEAGIRLADRYRKFSELFRLPAAVRSRTPYRLGAAVLLGAAAGYGSILFRVLIEGVKRLAFSGGTSLAALHQTPDWHLVVSPTLGGLCVGPLVYFLAREAEGHGIPEVKKACINHGGRIRGRVAVVKTIASAITIGSGGSVGREGPIAQIGASLGSFIGRRLGLSGQYLVDMVASGAGAGIAATFNAPIAGVVFALEIILERTSARHFSQLVVSTVVATVVARHYQGNIPAFGVPPYSLVSAWELPLYVLLGVFAAPVGVAFSRGLAAIETLWERLPVPRYAQAAIGGACVGAMGIAFPQLLGIGYEHIESTLGSHSASLPGPGMMGIGALLLLVGLKILAASITLASGGSGGVLAPMLFLGASLGGAFGHAAHRLAPPGVIADAGAYALVGMGAVAAATMQAPLTGMLIVFELTDRHAIILPLMLACIISTVFSFRLSRESIFTLALTRRGTKLSSTPETELVGQTKVRTLLDAHPPTVRPDAPLLAVVDRAVELDQGRFFVTDRRKRLLGEIALDDVALHVKDDEHIRRSLKARDLMHPAGETVREDADIAHCMALLSQPDVWQIPVVDSTGRLKGRMTRVDLMAFMSREVLRRDAVLSFVEQTSPGRQQGRGRRLVRLPTGEYSTIVPVGGKLTHKTLRELNLRVRYGINVYAIQHADGQSSLPNADETLHRGDSLLVVGPAAEVAHLRQQAAPRDDTASES